MNSISSAAFVTSRNRQVDLDLSDAEASGNGPSGTMGRMPPRGLGWRLLAGMTLAAADALSYVAAGMVVLAVAAPDELVLRGLGITAVVAISLFWSQALYPGYRVHGYELLRRRCLATLRVGVVAVATALALSEGWAVPAVVAAFLCIALAVQPLARALFRGLLWRAGLWGERAVIVGAPTLVAELTDYFDRHWQYGIVPQAEATIGRPASIALVAGGHPSRQEVEALRLSHSDVILLADLPGLPISGLRPAEIAGEVGLRLGGEAAPSAAANAMHRVFDSAVAALGLLVAMPLLLIAAAGIYIVDPGPIFYRQVREGRGGRPIAVLKLRTMYRDADARLEALLASDPEARAEWDSHFKLRHDPRILPGVGGFLRGSSIDELPQFFNVIVGDMRLVGPRPFPIYHLAALDAAFRVRRRSVTPGLTGIWQISDRSNADLTRQCQLDEFYIDNRSFWFDLHILLKTVPAVVRGDGAY